MISKFWEIMALLITGVFFFTTVSLRLDNSPLAMYSALPTGILIILLVIHFIRKEFKYRQFCKDFWD